MLAVSSTSYGTARAMRSRYSRASRIHCVARLGGVGGRRGVVGGARGDGVAQRVRLDEPVEHRAALHAAPRQAEHVLERGIGEHAAPVGRDRDAVHVGQGRVDLGGVAADRRPHDGRDAGGRAEVVGLIEHHRGVVEVDERQPEADHAVDQHEGQLR